MKNLKIGKILSRNESTKVIGGVQIAETMLSESFDINEAGNASCSANCGGGKTVTCSGNVCQGKDNDGCYYSTDENPNASVCC